MENSKTFEFHGTPGEYFVVFLVTVVCAYIPLFGWPIGFNYGNEWIAKRLTINGRAVYYKAGYGETLKFLLINLLLIMVTFGVYMFWFVPKQYRFIAAHAGYVDEMATAAPVASAPMPSAMPAPMNTPSIEPTVEAPSPTVMPLSQPAETSASSETTTPSDPVS